MDEQRHEEALELASEAGHILLENGAEIERVEDTMQRIATHYGAGDGSFFVLSNGIISTGHGYADAKFLPIRGARLDKVAAVNQVSREVASKNLSLEQLRQRLQQIRQMPGKPVPEQLSGSILGAGFFAMIFGGSLIDSAVAASAGLVMWLFMAFVAAPHLSRLLSNIFCGLISAIVCIICYKSGIGDHLGNMIIGAIIPLVPGVPFTNGMRDIANEDYIAGFTRLADAFMLFMGIAAGVMTAFLVDGYIEGKMMILDSAQVATQTFGWGWQMVAAFFGTSAFAILFGVPRKNYLDCGLAGVVGWAAYLAATRYLGCTPAVASLIGATVVVLASRSLAGIKKCPTTIFLVCGLFPLVPGGGLFWTSYYLVTSQWHEAMNYGILSIKITIAIALGIILVGEMTRISKKRKQ